MKMARKFKLCLLSAVEWEYTYLFLPFKILLEKPSLALLWSQWKTSMTTAPRWWTQCWTSVMTCSMWTWPRGTWTGTQTVTLSLSSLLTNQLAWQRSGKSYTKKVSQVTGRHVKILRQIENLYTRGWVSFINYTRGPAHEFVHGWGPGGRPYQAIRPRRGRGHGQLVGGPTPWLNSVQTPGGGDNLHMTFYYIGFPIQFSKGLENEVLNLGHRVLCLAWIQYPIWNNRRGREEKSPHVLMIAGCSLNCSLHASWGNLDLTKVR